MGKKRSWFSFVKRLFIPEGKSKPEKKSKKWRWVFGKLKLKQYPALAAPQSTLSEATEEQRKHALVVAIATAAAAEAAVASARAAAQVVRLTGVSHEFGKRNQILASIKIQTAFRAYLARKALRALKGVVRLQAMIRGQIVRSRVIAKLKCLQSITKPDSKVHHLKVPYKDGENRQLLGPKKELDEKEMKSHRNWDYNFFPKEDMESLWLRKQDPMIKRELMKKYSFSHRERRNDQALEESITNKGSERKSHRFEQWEAYERREKWETKSNDLSNLIVVDTCRTAQPKLRNAHKLESVEELNSPFSLPRRSFCRGKQKPTGDDSSLPNSPVFPTYMASTESAKLKARSMSTPKQRLGLFDTYSGYSSPRKLKISSWSSFNGEVASSTGRSGTSQLISANMKRLYRD